MSCTHETHSEINFFSVQWHCKNFHFSEAEDEAAEQPVTISMSLTFSSNIQYILTAKLPIFEQGP